MCNTYKDLECRLSFESNNAHDKNAIVIQVKLGGSWEAVGYVGGANIPRVTNAINKNEVVYVKLSKIRSEYRRVIRSTIYNTFILITKTGKWQKSTSNYVYNMIL